MPPLADLEHVERLLARLVEREYDDLAGVRLELFHFRHPTVFFRSRPTVASLLWIFGPLRYRIGVNPEAFERELPEEAARAILAHELAHTVQYRREGRRAVLSGLWSLLHAGFKERFERRTDLEAILRGFAPGLAEYRRWLGRMLGPAAIGRKIRFYYSAEEIERLGRALTENPELAQRWRSDPDSVLAALG